MNSTSRTLISRKDIKDASNAKKLLESWVNDAILGLFPDTRDCSPSLDNFFVGEKKVSEGKHRKRATQPSPNLSHRPPSPTFRTVEDHPSTSQRLGSTVKQLTPSDLQSPLIASSIKAESYPSVQLKRNLGAHENKVWEVWLDRSNVVRYMGFMTATVCLCYVTLKLTSVRFSGMRRVSSRAQAEPRVVNTGSLSNGLWGSAFDKGNLIAEKLRELSLMQKKKLKDMHEDKGLQGSSVIASSVSSRRLMHAEEAENLVKQWQTIKAEALGPNYQVHNLVDVLDEPMLLQWRTLAEEAKDRCCFWRFVLLQLSILRADILLDGMGKEMAEIEALVEEAAELVDESHQKNPNYYSTYTIRYLLKRQEDGSWRFYESDIQTPS